MLLLGLDVGTSSIKASLLEVNSGLCVASAQYPDQEAPIHSLQTGWAEQSPESWWQFTCLAIERVLSQNKTAASSIKAIGISYQMHGLVCVDKNQEPLRNSIIWCDSRAIPYGEKAFHAMGPEKCLAHHLNSPGNFTAAKLAWVKENEPALYEKIDKIMLPGDFISMKLTGTITTSPSALSEGVLWDFEADQISDSILSVFGFDASLIPPVQPVFSEHGKVTHRMARQLGLPEGIPVTYKAGDQPNNAFSLNVMEPGEMAATAGTSGVVYGVSDKISFDPASRVNSFAHVNHTKNQPRIGILLCINGTGILNSWLRNQVFAKSSYNEINALAAQIPVGSDGLLLYPFGNGAERVLENRSPGAAVKNLQFNVHTNAHLARAAQEGIVWSLQYGMEIMQQMGMPAGTVRAGYANMFLSPVFSQTFADSTGSVLELYNTDGSLGAARAAGWGAGIFTNRADCFRGMQVLQQVEPNATRRQQYMELYANWKNGLSS